MNEYIICEACGKEARLEESGICYICGQRCCEDCMVDVAPYEILCHACLDALESLDS